jgi:hypothetical protein
MVIDLSLKGNVGKRGLMFVSYYGRTRAFISNYKSWHEYQNQGKITEIAMSLISHESLHLTMNKFSLSASAKLDNLFGRSNSWENYTHGLGDIDRAGNIYTTNLKYASKGRKKFIKSRRRSLSLLDKKRI